MTRKSKYTITLFLLTFSAVILNAYKSTAQRQTGLPTLQEHERMIVKKTDFNPPVSIKAVKAKGRSVFLGNRFTDSDDWLKGLTVRLDNNSDKSFNYVRIEVQFNRPEGRTQDPPAIWYLEYGDYPFSYKTEHPNRVKHVLPGERVEVSLGDRDFNEMERFLKNAKYPSTNAVQLRITTIGFSDGTFWIVGRIFRRDAESPSGWRPITPTSGEQVKQPRGSARNRTANFLDMQKSRRMGAWSLVKAMTVSPPTMTLVSQCQQSVAALWRPLCRHSVVGTPVRTLLISEASTRK